MRGMYAWGHILVIAAFVCETVFSHSSPSERLSVSFDQERYYVSPGETFPVAVTVELGEGQSLASFGVRLSFDPESAAVAGVNAVEVHPELAFDGPHTETAVIAVGSGFAAAKGTIRFVGGEGRFPMNQMLVTFLLRDLGQGSYPLHVDFFNTLGPTEQIFVDGHGKVLDSEISFGTAQVVSTGGIEIEASAPPALNRQTGLFEQTVYLLNRRRRPVVGATISIERLPPGWQVWNATGTNASGPYLRVTSEILPASPLPVRVEFRIPGRNPTESPIYSVTDFEPEGVPDPLGESFALVPRVSLPDGTFLLEFATLADRSYVIQYSRDLTHWLTVSPPLRGNGSRAQWIDYGPPKTDRPPNLDSNRFYRVFLLP